MAEPRPHHVVVEVDRSRFHSRLREIEAWLAEWEVNAEIGSALSASGLLRIRFADKRAAYAFQRCHGGKEVPAVEIAAARQADADDDDLYDRLAREFPE